MVAAGRQLILRKFYPLKSEMDKKGIKYVPVHDPNSSVGRYLSLNQESFALLDRAENAHGAIFVYKVAQS